MSACLGAAGRIWPDSAPNLTLPVELTETALALVSSPGQPICGVAARQCEREAVQPALSGPGRIITATAQVCIMSSCSEGNSLRSTHCGRSAD
jgi:hypothetical protein